MQAIYAKKLKEINKLKKMYSFYCKKGVYIV